MSKKLIQRYMPDPKTIRDNKTLKLFGPLVHSPNLWHMNRRSIAGAFAVGMFMAAMPVPFQMILAAGGAIVFRVNLPVSVALVWITNPITMPFMFFMAYVVGATALGQPIELGINDFTLSQEWLAEIIGQIGRPFLFGCFLFGVTGSILGYFGIRLLWRINVVRQWQLRKDIRAARLQ